VALAGEAVLVDADGVELEWLLVASLDERFDQSLHQGRVAAEVERS
jgi:hypothetical protein